MPCDDISETGIALFNREEKLVSYFLKKKTCGAPIQGEKSLHSIFLGLTMDQISDLTSTDIEQKLSPRKTLMTFDDRKLAFALSSLCRYYLGFASDLSSEDSHSHLELESVDFDPEGNLTLEHSIVFPKNLEIKGCSSKCSTGKGSCGTHTHKKEEPLVSSTLML
jgi:hypothetical protein